MSSTKNEHIPLGSGYLYAVSYTSGSAIPEDSVIEVEDNLVGRIEKGAEVNYKPTYKKFSDDYGEVVREAKTAEEAALKASLISWSFANIQKYQSESTVSETSGKRTIEIGGLKNHADTIFLWRFVHPDADFGDLRLTMCGKNEAEMKLTYKPEDAGNMDIEVSARALSTDGVLIKIDESIPTA